MATSQETVDTLLEHLTGGVRTRKMFGEYCVYLDEKPVALVCDDRLFLKPTAAGRELLPGAAEEPPYPGAKPHLVVPPELWADGDAMGRLLRATFEALPKPKPRKKRG